MEGLNKAFEKCKGLKNGKDWEYGVGKIYKDGLAIIQRGDNKYYVFKDSLSMFTGAINSMGQEIFEGDLLEAEVIDAENIIKCVQQVVWDQVDQQWKVEYFVRNKVIKEALNKALNKKIIGHVYTHQYLLKSPSKLRKVEYEEKTF